MIGVWTLSQTHSHLVQEQAPPNWRDEMIFSKPFSDRVARLGVSLASVKLLNAPKLVSKNYFSSSGDGHADESCSSNREARAAFSNAPAVSVPWSVFGKRIPSCPSKPGNEIPFPSAWCE